MDTTDEQDTQEKRLIEVDFPLKQTSLDSVHEKNVRHGHISTLHIWPARRPLAASRAALITTLLPDPGNDEERKIMMEKLAGRIVEHVKKKKLPSSHRSRLRPRGVSYIGGANLAQTCNGSAIRSVRRMADAPPGCSIPSQAAEPFPWKRCDWAVKSLQ